MSRINYMDAEPVEFDSNIEDFDIWDQSTLTDIIVKPLERAQETEGVRLGDMIMPLVDHTEMEAKIRVADINAFGKGQFRAPAASPPLFKTGLTWEEKIIGLVHLDEMEEIDEVDMRKLRSRDETTRRSAGVDLVTRGQIARIRNERLSEAMRWAALSGALVVTYPTGDKLHIDYGLPSGHKPTAAPLWSDTANSDPIGDIEAWSQLLADDSGFYGVKLHMSSRVWGYLVQNENLNSLINYTSSNSNWIMRPTREQVLELMSTFAAQVDIVVYNQGYRDVGAGDGQSSITRYLPENVVLLTTDYVLDGVRIADMLDGPVTVLDGWNSTVERQGFQTEVMLDQMSKMHFFRTASTRMPRILIPEAILYATVA